MSNRYRTVLMWTLYGVLFLLVICLIEIPKEVFLEHSAILKAHKVTTFFSNEQIIGKVMSLLFNTLSRFVIAFLPRSFPSITNTKVG